MAQLSVTFGYSYKEIGFAVVSYTVASAVSQPLFGYVGDRWGGRLVATAGIVWIAFWMAVAGFAPNYYILVASLTLAGLGSGAYHPQGAVSAATKAKKGSGTSIFFMGGRLGFTAAPLLGGLMFARLGPSAMGFASILGLVVALGVWQSFPTKFAAQKKASGGSAVSSVNWLAQVPLIALVGFVISQGLRSGVNEMYTTYLPKLYLDRGFSPSQYGLLASIYVAGSSIGGLLGGILADRWSKKWIISGSMILAAPVMYIFIHSGSETRLVLALLTGTLLAIPFTPALLIAQELLPERPSFITGVTMSFFFIMNAIGTSLTGVLADAYGLALVMSFAALTLSVAFVFSLLIPSELAAAPTAQPVPVPVPVESDLSHR
jgi:FSR family fosmidomycin resistance protein-like MFS transporter